MPNISCPIHYTNREVILTKHAQAPFISNISLVIQLLRGIYVAAHLTCWILHIMYLFQARTWISNVMYRGLFCVQSVKMKAIIRVVVICGSVDHH